VGHYGVFNGSRFRSEIAPRIADFILSNRVPDSTRDRRSSAAGGVAKIARGGNLVELRRVVHKNSE
jgi:poly(3-hydroxybutyrate) depolymerase